MPMSNPLIAQLVQMHRYMRPAGSHAEAAFCKEYIDCLPNVYTDKAGNRIGIIGDAPTIMWSSHTDTVHRESGTNQRLMIIDNFLHTHAEDKRSNCLGSDCTVGVWLMHHMYLAGVPGLYVWHAEEEIGGTGSNYIAYETPDLLANIQIAIALDRRGTTSVVTHQWAGRCASDAFATSLAAQLGDKFETDSRGTFTDTANYTHIIPECTNISVGYYDQHSRQETLDLSFALYLLERLKNIDVSALVVARDPSACQYTGSPYKFSDYSLYYPDRQAHRQGKTYDELEEISDLLWEQNKKVAAYLVALGFTRAMLEAELTTLDLKCDDPLVNTQ